MTTQVEPNDAGDPSMAMTVEDVCRLAWDYRTMRTMSARELVARSGYRERWRSVTVAILEEALRHHPEWVDAWIHWSEDKRISSGWSITDCGESGFDVGEDSTKPPVRYADRMRACAVFVRHEVASIADVGPLPESA